MAGKENRRIMEMQMDALKEEHGVEIDSSKNRIPKNARSANNAKLAALYEDAGEYEAELKGFEKEFEVLNDNALADLVTKLNENNPEYEGNYAKEISEVSSDDENSSEPPTPDDDVISARLSLQENEEEEIEGEQDAELGIDLALINEELDEELAESDTHLEDNLAEEEDDDDEQEIELEAEDEVSDASKPRLSVASEEDVDNLRGIALEDYTEEPIVAINEGQEARREFLETSIGKKRLYGIAFLVLISVGFLIFMGIRSTGGLQLSTARPTDTPDPNVPVPVNVELPGGWSFNLKKGHLNAEGKWDPFGAEWLVGTEICRWVALPYSTQLEAVIRTLHAGDPINIRMSNLDVLTYYVQSRKEVDPNQAEELNLEVPSLLLILSEEDSDQKWVLTAVLNPED